MRPAASDVIVVDFETNVDVKAGYSLAKMSTRAYIADPRFSILSVSIGLGDSDAIDFFHKFGEEGGSLDDARSLLATAAEEGKWLVSHNVMFDGLVLALRWGIRFAHYFDTTAILRFLGYTASLANGARVVGLEKQEPPSFTEAALRDPAELARFARYNVVDVDIARALLHKARTVPLFGDLEWWCVDTTARENLAGVAVDLAHAAALSHRFGESRNEKLTALVETFPTFDTSTLSSPEKLKAIVKERFGVKLENLDKRNPDLVAAKRSVGGEHGVAAFLGLREQVSTWDRHSKKLALIAQGTERIFGPLNYYGAHTGRFSGGGRNAERVNLQNLPKGSKGDFEDLKEIRSCLIAEPGESFVACDLSTIEPRVLALIARQDNLLEKFRSGEDLYIWFISHVFPGKRIVKGRENDHFRQLGKHTILGLGYGMGKRGFLDRLLAEGLDVTIDLVAQLHSLFNRLFPRIAAVRRELWRLFKRAFDNGVGSKWAGCTIQRIGGRSEGMGVAIMLPTGRPLIYRSMIKRREATHRGTIEDVYRYTDFYSFDASSPGRGGKKARKCADGRLRIALDPQTIIENIVQATARDLLVAQMREVERHDGIRVRFSVHDEGVFATAACTCPRRDDKHEAGVPIEAMHEPGCAWLRGRGIVETEMSMVPACLAALRELPVACEVSDSIRDSYGK